MKQRFLAAILAVIMVFSGTGIYAIELETVESAAETAVMAEDEATLQGTSFEGSGTAADPYIISDAEDFIAFTDAMNAGSQHNGKYFKQTADIDLAGRDDYSGCLIGSGYTFYGTYDGNGHTINVDISASERCLFSYVYGTIMNLGTTGSITNTATSGTKYAAGIARSIQANAKLINCYSTMTLTGGQVAGLSTSMYGTANNCYFAGTLSGSSSNRAICTAVKTTSSFTNCYYTTGELGSAVATSVTDDAAKTTLAATLNAGRQSAADAAGVALDSIYHWTNENGYPEHYVYVDPGITGTGTKADPYVIDSASDFITFTGNINGGTTYSGKYIVQEVNIDLSANADYIGTTGSSAAQFSGIYNGKGHTIKLAMDTTGKSLNNTVFPYVNGTIMNLGTIGSIKNDGSYLAGIARSMRAGSKLINCYSTLTLNGKSVGGLTASNYGRIENCYFGGKITASSYGYAISQSTNGGTYGNCYFVSGCGATVGAGNSTNSATSVAESDATTILAATLNAGRASAAEALGVTKKEVYNWTNENGLPALYKSQYEEVSITQSSEYVAAGSDTAVTFTVEEDYVTWNVDTGYSDATYSVSGDGKTLTVNVGDLAGVVKVYALSPDEEKISEDYSLIIHSGKAGIPGVNMINGLTKEVDFEDGYSYGIKDINDKALSAGDIPEIDYSASVNSSGETMEALKNSSSKAVLADASSANKGDGWYYVFKTAVSGLVLDRNYTAYAQIYTDSAMAHGVQAWFNNFKETDAKGSLSITYNARTNSWKEFKITGAYARNTTAPPAFNTKMEPFVYADGNSQPNACTITVAAIDNMYLVPHYKITYHMPDGTEEIMWYNPIVTEYPLEISTSYVPEKTYEEGNYYDETAGKYSYYSGLWSTTKDGAGYSAIPLENKDIDLYPEKLSDGSAIYKLDSEASSTFDFSENVTVTDEYNSATITGNGTSSVTVTGKGYNAVLPVVNEAGEKVATINLVGNHKWRPGLNIFTGTKDGYDIETASPFGMTASASIAENPVKDSVNGTERVLKISSGTAMFNAVLSLETPIEWDRPYRVDYDVTGKLGGSYWHMMNTTNSSCILKTYAASTVSETEWKHVAIATNPLWKVDKGSQPYLNKFIIQGTGLANDSSYALYIDNFSIIPAYKIEHFNDRGDKIDVAFYNPMKADTEEVFLATTYKVDYNPNANYIVNGTPVATNGEYTLAYEDLKITVLPNDNAIMFSGTNASIVVPDGDTYVIPYPHELEGFLAEDFVIWKDADGNEIAPGTEINTSDYVGETIYAYCDASAYPRSPANGAVMNMAAIRHNNWLANYQPGNIARKADMGTISERGASFRWEAVPNAVSYKVYYSVNSNMSDSKYVSTSNTTVKAYHLLRATKYYWYVEATLSDESTVCTEVWTFTTADVANTYWYLNNTRDIGGMVTEDGLYKIKQNMAIRGGVVDGSKTTLQRMKESFGIRAELDLRGVEAEGRTVSPFGEDVTYVLIEGTHYFGNSSSSKHYLNATGQARLKEEVQFFADEAHYPCYYHCSAGRDRTGVISYIIQALLGIPEDVIMKDYELSWLSGSAASQANSAKYFGWMNNFHDYIDTYEGETFKDRMESFCLYIGVTQEEIDSIRNILLEPTTKLKPITLKLGSMRLSGTPGIRIAGFVTNAVRESAQEYGFVAALESNFTDGDYSALTVDNTDIKTVLGVAYQKTGRDRIYIDARQDTAVAKKSFGIETVDDNGIYFTGIYVNMPETAAAYTTDIVGRTYAKIDGVYYYGTPVVKNLYRVAVSLKELYTENAKPIPEYVQKVIDTVEKSAE